jgi:hypothetical protein
LVGVKFYPQNSGPRTSTFYERFQFARRKEKIGRPKKACFFRLEDFSSGALLFFRKVMHALALTAGT